jgi:uncharacterized protein (DUF934 family)
VNHRLPNMLRDADVLHDETRLFDALQEQLFAAEYPPDEPGWAVTLSTWVAHRCALRARRNWVGVQLMPDDDIAKLLWGGTAVGHIDPEGIAFIAIEFPTYTDGRGFSLAQLLRADHAWKGELRAVGDVLIDTVHYLARCGFNSFVLKPGHDPFKAAEALSTFSANYQRSYTAIGS